MLPQSKTRQRAHLRANEKCPIHNSYWCPCRPKPEKLESKKQIKGWVKVAPGVLRIPDDSHPGGFRERRTPSAMRQLLHFKIREQEGCCADISMGGCGLPFGYIGDVRADHIDPRRMGGAFRCDCSKCIQALHNWCNREKGSRHVR